MHSIDTGRFESSGCLVAVALVTGLKKMLSSRVSSSSSLNSCRVEVQPYCRALDASIRSGFAAASLL